VADPTVSTTGVVARIQADTDFNAFQLVNGFGDTQLLVGNIFLGIQGGCVFKFTGAGIPKGSTIKSAVIDVVADDSSGAAGVTTQIQGVAMGPDKAWVPGRYGLSTPKWRRDFWGTFAADVRNLAAATIVDTVPAATNQTWGLRQLLGFRQKMAQRFTVPAGAGDTLGDIRLELTRAGAPAGTLSLEVRVPRDNDPTGELLAVSDPVVAAGIPAGPSDVTFTFSGVNQIALEGATTYYVVLRSDLPYPTSAVDWIGWRQRREFFGPGGGRHFGVGRDWDNQNYPGVADVFEDITDQVGVDVAWSMPPFVIGTTYTTPDITEIVQAIVSDQYYQSGGPIGIAFDSFGNTGQRRIAAEGNPARDSAVLRVEYCPPDNNLQGGSSFAIYKARAEVETPLKPTAQPMRTPAAPAPPPAVVEQSRWIDFSKLGQLATGPAVNEYVQRPPIVVEQGRDVAVPPTKAPGLQTGHTPAPPPRVQPQHRPEQLDRIPQKPAGPPLVDATPAPAAVRPEATWLRERPPDTTPVRTDARSDAPPTVTPVDDDLVPGRRVAPPPPRDPARRSVTVPGVSQPQNLRQFVYDWGRSVLRWEAAHRQLGDRNPLAHPPLLQIPPEFAWGRATERRLDLDEAWRDVLQESRDELLRMIAGTDAPPALWGRALERLRPTGVGAVPGRQAWELPALGAPRSLEPEAAPRPGASWWRRLWRQLRGPRG